MLLPNSLAQEDVKIPDWIKNSAGWWAADEISENEFLSGITYLINNNVIKLGYTPCSEIQTTSSASLVPDWVKNNASWWATNQIGDSDFINGIKYLILNDIISIDNRTIVGDVPFTDVVFSPSWKFDKTDLVFIDSAFFESYGAYGDCITIGGDRSWSNMLLGLDQNKMDIYEEVAVWDDPQKVIVVYPHFTSMAYTEPGFYTYYRGECDHCTTTSFSPPTVMFTASGLGHQALSLLGYPTITDLTLDQNPSVLQQYDKVIVLHNEYVTRAMFDAITNHPNVLYLYPNALYAEIEVDYENETITLIRGHDYPPEDPVSNGFDWEFDNTHPYEYDTECLEMEIYKIDNGWMTNCYPENVFLSYGQAYNLLKLIKEI